MSSTDEKIMELQKKLEVHLGKGVTQSLAGEALLPDLSRAALELGVTVYTGTIAYVGKAAAGDGNVQFNANNNTAYSSSWPAWAWEQAKLALSLNKRTVVLANGQPFGANLVQVLVMAS